LLREEFRLPKLTFHSYLRRRAASRRALPRTSSSLFFTQPPSGRRRMRICIADVFYADYFCFVFVFVFFRPPKLWDNRSRERLNGFSWNFHQTIPGNMEFETSCRRLAKVVQPPGEWRKLMTCVIYAMTLPESPEGATAVALYNNERANWCNLV